MHTQMNLIRQIVTREEPRMMQCTFPNENASGLRLRAMGWGRSLVVWLRYTELVDYSRQTPR